MARANATDNLFFHRAMAFEIFNIEIPNGRDELERLNRFLENHRVVSTQHQMVTRDNIPYMCFCLEYTHGQGSEAIEKQSPREEKKDAWTTLKPEERLLFNQIRNLRNAIATEEHVKSFVVFTNDQLAEMVKRRVTTMEAMKGIPDIGRSRLEKYCPRLLELLKQLFSASGDGDATSEEEAATSEVNDEAPR